MPTQFYPSSNRASEVDVTVNSVTSQPENFHAQHVVALVLAILTTSTSLGIATYAGWQRGGLLVERLMSVALGSVAVLYVHMFPMAGRPLHVPARICASAMWCVSVVVVLYGQVAFFMISHQHAGNQRASTVQVSVAPLQQGRTLTSIAQDVVKVSTSLASANARHCEGECSNLKVRRAILMAQLTALNTEAGEAKRREVAEDRRNEQVDRNEALRATLRADPVVSAVATWLGTTESGFELMLAVASAVVLEGAAIVGWLLVSVASGRAAVVSDSGLVTVDSAGRRATIASSRVETVPELGAVAPDPAAAGGESSSSRPLTEDELLLNKIHEAVMTGQLKPTQEAIRKHLSCGQPKAGNLNRQYLVHFGNMRSQGDNVRAPGVAMHNIADA